jgi:D-glycero-D-manno-heptose 1,7-bisphosphate phosphatase
MEPRGSPALLLDRDGVIIENRADYVRSWGDVKFIASALPALASLRASDYKVAIVTNQSAVGRGLLSLIEAEAINCRVVEHIEGAGGRIDGVFMCPHTPEDGCSCRKPKPGLLLQAAEAINLDLRRSILIGDTIGDLQAGAAGGVGTLALVRTGLGAEHALLLAPAGFSNIPVYPDLAAAVEDLLPRLA